MFSIKRWCKWIVTCFTLILLATITQAQQPSDTMSCGAGTVTTIAASPELTVMVIETKGIQIDNLASKFFDNMTYDSVGLFKIENGKFTGTSYMKYMDPSGDFVIVESTKDGGMDYNWKYLYGSGKYKGITGGGKALPSTKGKPISPGTSQGCFKITGTYELKK